MSATLSATATDTALHNKNKPLSFDSEQHDKPDLVSDNSKNSDRKDPAYFDYYSQFIHQQNMLQDQALPLITTNLKVRTMKYYEAIVGNPQTFINKSVMDLGAGSGILSYFAAMAGASSVVSVEASSMAQKIQKMVDCAEHCNPWMKDKITVVESKIENPELRLEKVDVLVSEPIGVLIIHERMMESYFYARDHFLKPGGIMVPSSGEIKLAPFSDPSLWTSTNFNVRFWQQDNFYGVNFSPLAHAAKQDIFSQPVVGPFDSRILLSSPCSHKLDFKTLQMTELQEFTIPIHWTLDYTGIIHGIAGWFDINLNGISLCTSPSSPTTHWQQVRFLLKSPLAVNAHETLHGCMTFSINAHRSYDLFCELYSKNETLECLGLEQSVKKRVGTWKLHEQTYAYDNSAAGGVDLGRLETNSMYESDALVFGNAAVPMDLHM